LGDKLLSLKVGWTNKYFVQNGISCPQNLATAGYLAAKRLLKSAKNKLNHLLLRVDDGKQKKQKIISGCVVNTHQNHRQHTDSDFLLTQQ